MQFKTIIRPLVLSLALGAVGTAALADGDRYFKLFEMKAMDQNKDGMVSKKEFLDMMAKAWDAKMEEAKLKGDKMSAEQIKELEKVLGRTLSAHGGN
jgi:hypothetical protein